MKYSNTSRVLSLIFHALIALGFGALGVYFAFFVVPFQFSIDPFYAEQIVGAFNLYFELGAIGLSLCTISVYGFLEALKSLKEGRADNHIVKAFTAFIVEGYIAAIFFLLNGVVYFNLVSGGSIGFVVIVCLVLTIGLMIATNIPMVKLYDGKDQKPLLLGFILGGGVFFCAGTIQWLGALIGSLTRGVYSRYQTNNTILLSYLLAFLVITALLGLSAYIMMTKGSEGKNGVLIGHMISGSVLLAGGYLLTSGIFEFVTPEKFPHLNGENIGNAYGIACLVVGSLVIIGALALEILNISGKALFKSKKA